MRYEIRKSRIMFNCAFVKEFCRFVLVPDIHTRSTRSSKIVDRPTHAYLQFEIVMGRESMFDGTTIDTAKVVSSLLLDALGLCVLIMKTAEGVNSPSATPSSRFSAVAIASANCNASIYDPAQKVHAKDATFYDGVS